MRRAVLVVLALAGVGACTFPSVEYTTSDGGTADGGGGGQGGAPPSCAVSMKCATNASSCAKKADADEKACENKCKPPDQASCKAECDGDKTTDIAACAAACVTCVALPSCPNVPKDCSALAVP